MLFMYKLTQTVRTTRIINKFFQTININNEAEYLAL